MTAHLIDGKALAAIRKEQLKQQIQEYTHQGNQAPGLAVVIVGENPASLIYVTNKRKACDAVGIRSYQYNLPTKTDKGALLNLINELNNSQDVDGILIQLPLPPHIDSDEILEAVNPNKDVDGFHPYNLGCLAQKRPKLRPCTPLGIINLLNYYQLPIAGKNAVVIGRSNIVGKPMCLELLLAGATVTVCHSLTNDLQHFVEHADLLILATGKQDLVQAEWLKEHQVVVDVGIHRLENGRIRGDIDFFNAQAKVSWITPVPGGVGPMTIVSLLENTLLAAELRRR
jgi:methylenetetrahydrofolate dehydrogenase (NADP+)/methenyltetrahydrofolate cyclohydrolase